MRNREERGKVGGRDRVRKRGGREGGDGSQKEDSA